MHPIIQIIINPIKLGKKFGKWTWLQAYWPTSTVSRLSLARLVVCGQHKAPKSFYFNIIFGKKKIEGLPLVKVLLTNSFTIKMMLLSSEKNNYHGMSVHTTWWQVINNQQKYNFSIPKNQNNKNSPSSTPQRV